MEMLVGLTPLHIVVQKEAAMGARRTQLGGLQISNRLMKLLSEIECNFEIPVFSSITDQMVKKYNFKRPFKIQIWDRDQWMSERPVFESDSIVFYTDGSKTDAGVGVGVWGSENEICAPLGITPTVFQAEVSAIDFCIALCLEKGYRNKKVTLLSDSQAAIKALNSSEFVSKLAWDCLNKLLNLAQENEVTIMWVPGHMGIEGNERADELARNAANSPLLGPEPFCGVPKCSVKRALKVWEQCEIDSYWNRLPGHNRAKFFMPFSSKSGTKEALNLKKSDLRKVIGMYTGHCDLKLHQFVIGRATDR